MVRIKLSSDTIQFISMFETLTRVHVKDCFEHQEKMVYVVPQSDLGKAIGKNSSNVKRIESLIKKKIKIIGFSDNLEEFVKNAIHPLKVTDIQIDDGTITLTPVDHQTRGMLIGRGAQNLRGFEMIIQKYFDEVKELKVT